MKNKIFTIALKELRNYWYSPLGYIFAGLLIGVTNWLFFQDYFVNGQAEMVSYWGTMIYLLTIFVPSITMNLLAEEKKNSTWELVLSLPVSEKELVLGKYLGGLVFVTMTILLSMTVVITVLTGGKVDLGVMLGGITGVMILAWAYLAVGLFVSCLTNQPIIAFLITVIILLVNNLMSQEIVLMRLPVILKDIASYLSLSWHANNFNRGVIYFSDIIFYLSWIVIFIFLSSMTIRNRGK